MQTVTITQHIKDEWSRMATKAYATGHNMTGHVYSVAAALRNNEQLPIARFDQLQSGYRAWLIDDVYPNG